MKPPKREGKRPQTHPEDELQRALVAYFREAVRPGDAVLFAIPNGEKRDLVTAGKLVGISRKARARMDDADAILPYGLGVLPGASDLVLVLPAARTIYVEVKIPELRDAMGRIVRQGGTLSKNQRLFRGGVEALEHTYRVADSIEVFDTILRESGLRLRTHPLTKVAFTTPPKRPILVGGWDDGGHETDSAVRAG
jgi:hypothetical protein